MRYASVKEFEKSLTGGEPSWESGNVSLSSALNWYNYNSDCKESKKFAIQYLKHIKENKNVISKIEKVLDDKFQNLGFVCRMQMRGAPLSEKQKNWIKTFFIKLETLKQKEEKPKEKEVVTNTLSIQERVQEKSKEYIAELEGNLDKCIESKNFKTFKPYELMLQLGVKNAHTSTIKKFFIKRLSEFEGVLSSTDAVIKEGYSNFTKKQLKEYIELLNTVIADCDKLSHNAKLTRAPRKKKPKSVEKVLEKVQFKKEDVDLKLVSVKPTEILGCKQLWIYNTKLRKLGVYNAKDADGLSIKGTTLINFAEDTSVQKTLRKPEVVLSSLSKATKTNNKKIFDSVNSVESALTGRLNADTILLKIVK